MGKVNNFGGHKSHCILVLDPIDFLSIIHNEERLRNVILHIIMNVLCVRLQCNEPAACQLPNLLRQYLVRQQGMKLDLVDLLSIARALSIEYLLVVSSHHMSSEHRCRLTNDFEYLLVQRGLHYAVIELHNYHALLVRALLLSN